MGATITVRPMSADDGPRVHDLRVRAFSSAPTGQFDADDDRDYVPVERRLVAERGGEVVGHLGAWPLRQHLAGRMVDVAGIAGVTVDLTARNAGVASALVEQAIRDGAGRGEAFAPLFPNTQAVYRRLGWEIAGRWEVTEVPLQALRELPRPARPVELRDGDPQDDLATIVALERAQVMRHHGAIARSPGRLRWLLTDEDVHVVVAERDGGPTGALAWTRTTGTPAGSDRTSWTLHVHDLWAADHDTWLALWQLVGSNAGVAAAARYVAPPLDPLLTTLGIQPTEHAGSPWAWMTRTLDLDAAVRGRGWPTGGRLTQPLVVRDPVLGDRAATLEVADGRARLLDDVGDAAPVVMDVGAFSALLTGGLTATQLAWLGRLEGADADRIAALDETCRTPLPWTGDHF